MFVFEDLRNGTPIDEPLFPTSEYTFENRVLKISGALSANIDGILKFVSEFPCEYKEDSIWVGGYFFETSDEKVEYVKVYK